MPSANNNYQMYSNPNAAPTQNDATAQYGQYTQQYGQNPQANPSFTASTNPMLNQYASQLYGQNGGLNGQQDYKDQDFMAYNAGLIK